MHKKVYLVGRSVTNNNLHIQGIFSTKEKAVKACRDSTYWVGELDLDKELPDKRIDWPSDSFWWPSDKKRVENE